MPTQSQMATASSALPLFTHETWVNLQTSKRSQSQIIFTFGFSPLSSLLSFLPLRYSPPRSKYWPAVGFAMRRFNYSAKAEISLTLNSASHMIDLEAPPGSRCGDFRDPPVDKGARCERWWESAKLRMARQWWAAEKRRRDRSAEWHSFNESLCKSGFISWGRVSFCWMIGKSRWLETHRTNKTTSARRINKRKLIKSLTWHFVSFSYVYIRSVCFNALLSSEKTSYKWLWKHKLWKCQRPNFMHW